MWAVRYDGRRCRLFHDMIAAVRLFNGSVVGAQLWKLCPDGWLMISGMVPLPKLRGQSKGPMNREVLVEGGA